MTDLEKHLQEIKSRIAAYFDCEGAKTIGACFWDLTALVVKIGRASCREGG